MTPDSVVTLIRQAIEMAMIAAGPLLLASLLTGLLVSIFQAATQINEMTLTFIPKLIVMFVVLVLLGPWMLEMMVEFMQRLYNGIPGLIG